MIIRIKLFSDLYLIAKCLDVSTKPFFHIEMLILVERNPFEIGQKLLLL